jgi:hypothetical protein
MRVSNRNVAPFNLYRTTRSVWYDAGEKLVSNYSGDAFFAGATDESFMEFAKAVAKSINFEHEVTGARVTRYTNAASGYPVYVLEVTSGGKGFRETTQPKGRRRMIMDYGNGYLKDYGEMVEYGDE